MIAFARVNGRPCNLITAFLVMTGTGAAAAAVVGAILGLLGGIAGPAARALLTALAAASFLVLLLRRLDPPQLNVETPREWLQLGDLRVLLFNGATLGAGLFSRLGSWMYYVLAMAALASGSPLTGAICFSVYGVARIGFSVLRTRVFSSVWEVERLRRFRLLTRRLEAGVYTFLVTMLVAISAPVFLVT